MNIKDKNTGSHNAAQRLEMANKRAAIAPKIREALRQHNDQLPKKLAITYAAEAGVSTTSIYKWAAAILAGGDLSSRAAKGQPTEITDPAVQEKIRVFYQA